ncbi:MAG: HEAT repeat domain-containing protein [Vicinamibacterales bacterium]
MKALTAVFVCVSSMLLAQQVRFDDVIRNLRNPDPKTRLASVQLLRESKYPEAIAPLAPLVNDPIDQIQLEAIATELSFFLTQDVPSKKRLGYVVEVRNPARAAAAFEMGTLALEPRVAPPELVDALLTAIDDEDPKVRIEAIYTAGTIARPPLTDGQASRLIKALDHYDPAIRAAAARVAGRLEVSSASDALITAINDSQPPVRYAAMRALGSLREVRAVPALAEQFTFYGKGEGAWSALDALAHIADPSSVPLFKLRLTDKDPVLRRAAAEGLGRAHDASEQSALEIGAGNDASEMVRAAMAFALQKLGRNYIPRLVESLDSDKVAPQAADYLLELGPSIAPTLVSHLQDPSPAIRANVATVLGLLGDNATLTALQPLTGDKDRSVAQAATRAIERIKHRSQSSRPSSSL